MQVVYSSTPIDNTEGRKVKNPRHFAEPIKDATKVFLNGDHPRIRAAYEAAGIPVADVSEMKALPGTAKPASPKPAPAVDAKP